MKVTLVNYTQDAAELLIFSKKTRLKMSPDSFAEIKAMSEEQKAKELAYVFGTIGSSWEFVDYVFLIQDVTRAFTHQIVRHRHSSFAQMAMRVVDLSEGFEYLTTGLCHDIPAYHVGMSMIKEAYRQCIEAGAVPQDARGLLPTNVLTNILAKMNLRSLSDILAKRLCYKTQGEAQLVARAMRDEVLKVHPWTSLILQVHCVQHGTCAFPGFKECPLKEKGLIPKIDKEAIKAGWEEMRFEAQPKSGE